MENEPNDLANNASADVVANPESDSHHVTESLRSRAIAGDLQSLAERIANSKELLLQLRQEVKSCRAQIESIRAAKLLSVTCSPGAFQLLRLHAMVDAEIARRVIECVVLK